MLMSAEAWGSVMEKVTVPSGFKRVSGCISNLCTAYEQGYSYILCVFLWLLHLFGGRPTDGHAWRALGPKDPVIEELRILCRDEVALIEERTALINQLRQALREYYPPD
jgi:hypothetical protein